MEEKTLGLSYLNITKNSGSGEIESMQFEIMDKYSRTMLLELAQLCIQQSENLIYL